MSARVDPGEAIITAALTGPIATKADNPALPTSPEEIGDAARGAWDAGAAIVHCHVRDPEIIAQLPRIHFHRARLRRLARLRLRKRRGHRRMKRNMPLHFLHRLMNVPIQHRHRAKALQITERLSTLAGAPPPLRINRP